MTGDDPNYLFRYSAVLYIADLLLGYEPWLNASKVCTFPEPWRTKPSSSPDPKPRTDIEAQRALEDYEGTYRNEAYGEIVIYINVTNTRLMCSFGVADLILYPKSSKDVFYGQGVGLMQNIQDISTFNFKYINGSISQLMIPTFESKDPPVFELVKRDRKRRNTSGAKRLSYRISSLQCVLFFVLSVLFLL